MSGKARQPAPAIGQVLRERRGHHGWTLADIAQKTGVSKATLSKIENDLISPSYQTILQLCAGLGIEISDLVAGSKHPQDKHRRVSGRRSISHQHAGLTLSDDQFVYTYLVTDIAHKRIVPMVVEVKAHSLQEIGELWNHVGEEFLYVLEGSIELHTEFYEPSVLEVGDAAYFDSTMNHAYVAVGDTAARLLICCSSATPNLAQTLREVLAQRLNRRASRRHPAKLAKMSRPQ